MLEVLEKAEEGQMKTICNLRGRGRVSFLAHQPSWNTVLNILQIPSNVKDPYILMENSYNTCNISTARPH